MSDRTDCPFCKPTDRVLKSNKQALVLLSNPRKTAGHFLVIPKRHIEKPWQLTTTELKDIFELIFFIEQKIIGKLGDGCDVRQNYRPFLKQDRLKIDHVHFHVIPRYFQDYIYQVAEKYETDLFTTLDDEEAAEAASLLD